MRKLVIAFSSSSLCSRKLRSAYVGEAAHQEGALIGGAGRARADGILANAIGAKMAPIFMILRARPSSNFLGCSSCSCPLFVALIFWSDNTGLPFLSRINWCGTDT
jgi:hypothetical protein